jgi:hypothetical protein
MGTRKYKHLSINWKKTIRGEKGNYMSFFKKTKTFSITTKGVSSNPVHGEVYSIQHYVIKVCQWLATGLWFSPGPQVSSTYKTDRHDITEILLKVALNTSSNNKTLNARFMDFYFVGITF